MTGSQDALAHISINALKRRRTVIKRMSRANPLRAAALKDVNQLIQAKQHLFHSIFQWVPGYKWGMKLRKKDGENMLDFVKRMMSIRLIKKDKV